MLSLRTGYSLQPRCSAISGVRRIVLTVVQYSIVTGTGYSQAQEEEEQAHQEVTYNKPDTNRDAKNHAEEDATENSDNTADSAQTTDYQAQFASTLARFDSKPRLGYIPVWGTTRHHT